VSTAVAATGAGPFQAGFANVGFKDAFAVGNFTALAVRATAGPGLPEISPNPSAGSVRLSRPGPAGPLTLGLRSLPS